MPITIAMLCFRLQFLSAESKAQMHFLPSTLCDVLSMCAELVVFAYVKVLSIFNLCSAKRNATPVFNVILCLYHRRNAASTTCSFISALRFFYPFRVRQFEMTAGSVHVVSLFWSLEEDMSFGVCLQPVCCNYALNNIYYFVFNFETHVPFI